MKKSKLIFVLILMSKIAIAQTYYSNYLDSTSEWRYISGGWSGIAGYTYHTTVYFDGFETVNGIVYYKEYSKRLYTSTDIFGNPISQLTTEGPIFVREDIDGKFYRMLPNSTTPETMSFDNQEIINAQVGDPFPYPGATCNVQSTETIYLGSVPLKKINGTVSGSTTGSLEGIGVIGLACALGIEYGGNLHCYKKQNNNIQFGTVDCNSFPIPIRVNLSFQSNALNDELVSLYPNPTNGKLKIKLNETLIYTKYEIYDVYGKVIAKGLFNEMENEIDLISNENGLYLLKIETENSTVYKKIIKQ